MQTEIKEGVLVITLEGNLLGEHTNVPVMELINKNLAEGNKRVLFNLNAVKFINSTGLGMLMSALTKVRNAGGELGLCSLPDQMKKLLQMTKLENIFPVFADEAAAIATLNSK